MPNRRRLYPVRYSPIRSLVQLVEGLEPQGDLEFLRVAHEGEHDLIADLALLDGVEEVLAAGGLLVVHARDDVTESLEPALRVELGGLEPGARGRTEADVHRE